MKEKVKTNIKNLTKKKWFIVTLASLLFLLLVYGVSRLAFAFDVVEWSGEFQYSTTNWYYYTTSYITIDINDETIMDYSKNPIEPKKFYANKGNGFYREEHGSETDLWVDQDELFAYLKSKNYKFDVGDTIHWYADAEVTFGYKDKATGKTLRERSYYPIDEAKAVNDEDSRMAHGGLSVLGFTIDDNLWEDTGIVLAVRGTTNGDLAFCHHFNDGGYWETLKEDNPIVVPEEKQKSSISIQYKDENGKSLDSDTEEGIIGTLFEHAAPELIEKDGSVYDIDGWEYVSSDGKDSGSGSGRNAEFILSATKYTLTFTYIERIVEEHECSFEWGNYDGNYHWYICKECGKSSEKHTHQMVAGESDPETGETVYTCECEEHEDCPYTYTKHKHSYVGWLPDPYDYPMEDGEWEEDYEFDPNKYHWKYCEYEDCNATSGKASHTGGEWEDEGGGYAVKRCTVCDWILDRIPVVVTLTLDPNGGSFPNGSTEPITFTDVTYGEVTDLGVLGPEYFAEKDGEELIGYAYFSLKEEGYMYDADYETKTCTGNSKFFNCKSDGTYTSKLMNDYTVYAQYKKPSYEVEYHPVSALAEPQRTFTSYHDIDVTKPEEVEKELQGNSYSLVIPITYSTGTEIASVETTVDNTYHAAEFKGWATSEERALAQSEDYENNGPVDYEDKESVANLLTYPGTVHLYAVWDYGNITLPNAISTTGGMKLSGWRNSDGNFYSVLDENGNYNTNNSYPLSDREEFLTAEWKANTYTVTFNSNGGSACEPIEVTYMEKYGTLPTTVKEGYTFAGWEDDISKNIVTEDSTVTLAANHTLNAKWEANPITVTLEYCFDFSDVTTGTCGKYATEEEKAALTYTDGDTDTFETYYNEFYSVLPTPYMEGYTFAGWYIEKRFNDDGTNGCGCGHTNCIVSNNTRISIVGDHTLYARWTEKQYKIYLDDNGDYSVEGE